MDLKLGHVFYISGLLVIFVMAITFLSVKKLDIIFEDRFPHPSKVRVFWGLFCLFLFLSGAAALFFNWSNITPLGRIPF